MKKRNSKLANWGIEFNFDKNLANEDSVFLSMYGNSLNRYSRAEALELAKWLRKVAVPALKKFGEAK